MDEEVESGGAYHRIDEDTGEPHWELWGEGWKDSDSMDPNEVMALDPRSFPPGTRIVVIEPGLDDEKSEAFYKDPNKFYPLKSELLEKGWGQ